MVYGSHMAPTMGLVLVDMLCTELYVTNMEYDGFMIMVVPARS